MFFYSHLTLAHHTWKDVIKSGDFVIDATCGNGRDAQVLAQLALTDQAGKLFALDIQPEAINSCKQRLQDHLPASLIDRVHFYLGCHSSFPPEIIPQSIKLIAYNLGYLPGGDKNLTTIAESTLKSLHEAMNLLIEGGMISITCYPGHSAGQIEEAAILEWAARLDPKAWNCWHHRKINRNKSPSVLLIQKMNRHLA